MEYLKVRLSPSNHNNLLWYKLDALFLEQNWLNDLELINKVFSQIFLHLCFVFIKIATPTIDVSSFQVESEVCLKI